MMYAQKDVTFRMKRGELRFLTGPSGAGKSTFLRLLFFALRPSAGKAKVFDRDVAKVAARELPLLRRRLGVVFQDYDNDGKPDVIVTELPREIYGVYHNDGGGSFSYRSLEAGLGVLSSGSSGWSVGLEDFDNDGWKDLFVAQGHVLDNVEQIDPSLHYFEMPLVALNHNGRFERTESGMTQAGAGRGAAFGDLNNDGAQDVVETYLGGHPQVLFNHPGKAHWLVITLRGTRSNRDGFGARVQVNGQTRFATSTVGYLSASDKRLHFGLGTAQSAKIEIVWPSGIHQVVNDVHADQFLEIREPEKP